MSRALGFIALLWFISAAACSVQETRSLPPPNLLRQTIVARVQQQIQAETERHLSVEETALLKALSSSDTVAADFKRRLALQSLTKPWAGMEAIESHAMLIAEMAAESEQQLPALIDLLEAGMDRTAEFFKPPTFPPGTQAEELTMFLTEVLEQAYQLREKALRSLDQDERQFLYDHAAAIAQNFTPHVGVLNDATTPMVKADRRFVQLVAEKVDYAALIASAQTLARLANHSWLRQLTLAFQNRTPLSTRPKGVTGDVLLARQTSYGTIIIGGSGPNTYDLDHRVSLVIDLGGDDTYRGAIAAAADLDQANSVVIDLSGNDTYNAAPLGLATGRLGVGLLVDQGGDDVYQLPPGAGGTGFGGLGIVLDEGGNDLYMGTRFTQGTAVGGLGLILDEGGNDRYTSYGYAVGFGG
ncbi:MAG: hypothetical protein ACT4OO_01500, partial [Nitrospiraceae bacterium]